MTIKELCSQYDHCYDCSFVEVCPYAHDGYWYLPLNGLNDVDNEQVTRAIIETARRLEECNTNE